MPPSIDTANWSGDGDFTRCLLDAIGTIDGIAAVRVEDSPASRSDTGYAFLSNEIYVTFATIAVQRRVKLLHVLPVTRTANVPALDVERFAQRLAACHGIGEADFRDAGMIQYLRAERVAAPWQTKGIKVVELVRIYGTGGTPQADLARHGP